MKPRTCKHCDTVIPLDRGFYYDDNLNLICGTCNEVLCPTEDEENKPNPPNMYQHGGF